MKLAYGLALSTMLSLSCSLATVEQERAAEKEKRILELWEAAQLNVRLNELEKAEKRFTELLKLNPDHSLALYYRGRVRFQLGKVQGSIEDFDRHVELSPDAKARQWERGISLYYAGKFAEGAEQFKIYQTYHDQDVENSAWRFLCLARAEDIATARENLLPIQSDPRVPMMQIYQMYQGKMSPRQVLKAAEELADDDFEKESARFYANLYVGLLYEVEGQEDLAIKHLKAAREHRINHYMWNVADVHLKLRQGEK